MTPEEHVDTGDDLGISPRARLRHIEEALTKIDAKLDMRFDSVEARLTVVESTQAGQASTAEFVARAAKLADEDANKAKKLADEATRKAAELALSAEAKATVLADEQKSFQTAIGHFETAVKAFGARLDAFDRKVAWFGGVGAALVFVSGFIGYLVH